MKCHRILCAIALVVCLSATGFAHHIAVVTNRDNPVQNLSSAALAKILKGETKKWGNGMEVSLVLHKSSPDENRALERLIKMNEQQLKVFLQAHKDSIHLVESDAEVIEAVASSPGALGLVEAHSITERITVVRVDGKLPLESGYLTH